MQPVMAWLKQAAKDARDAYLTCDCECPDHMETQSESSTVRIGGSWADAEDDDERAHG